MESAEAKYKSSGATNKKASCKMKIKKTSHMTNNNNNTKTSQKHLPADIASLSCFFDFNFN